MSLLQLPYDVKMAVLQSDVSGLDHMDLINMSSTCKHLRNLLVPTLFRELRFSSDPRSARSALAAAKAYPEYIKSLEFVGKSTHASSDVNNSRATEDENSEALTVSGVEQIGITLAELDTASSRNGSEDESDFTDEDGEYEPPGSEILETYVSDEELSDSEDSLDYEYDSGSERVSESEDELINLCLESYIYPYSRSASRDVRPEFGGEEFHSMEEVGHWISRQEQTLCFAARQLLSGQHTPKAMRLSIGFDYDWRLNTGDQRDVRLTHDSFVLRGRLDTFALAASAESRLILRARMAAAWACASLNSTVRDLNMHDLIPLRTTAFNEPGFRNWLGSLETLSISMGPSHDDIDEVLYLPSYMFFVERMDSLLFAHTSNIKSLRFCANDFMSIGQATPVALSYNSWRRGHSSEGLLPLLPQHMPGLKELHLHHIVLCDRLTAYLVGHAKTLETLEMVSCWAPIKSSAYVSSKWADLLNAYADSDPVLRRLLIHSLSRRERSGSDGPRHTFEWSKANCLLSRPDDPRLSQALRVEFDCDDTYELRLPYGDMSTNFKERPVLYPRQSTAEDTDVEDEQAYLRLIHIVERNAEAVSVLCKP